MGVWLWHWNQSHIIQMEVSIRAKSENRIERQIFWETFSLQVYLLSEFLPEGRVCKQVKLSHLGHRKPARIHWKVRCGFWSKGIIGLFFFKNEQGQAVTLNGDRFFSQKLKRRTLASFDFNSTALRATQPKLHLMFRVLFLKIAFSAAELISFDHLGTAIWDRWPIICGLPSKTSVTPTSQRQLTL